MQLKTYLGLLAYYIRFASRQILVSTNWVCLALAARLAFSVAGPSAWNSFEFCLFLTLAARQLQKSITYSVRQNSSC